MLHFCTLFDSGYIDRGLALYHSLEKVSRNFELYIFCFDDIAFHILCELKLPHVVVVSENDIFDRQLAEIKQKRRRAEYYWTCTPIVIEYVLEKYSVEDCTYIDADMAFYLDPEELIEQMRRSGAAASVIGHRFPKSIAAKKSEKLYGRYCVEFNTFRNNADGKKILSWWKEKCMESCTMNLYEEGYGDQKYLEQWEDRFGNIYETKDIGAGVAPWNISDYKLLYCDGDNIYLKYRNHIKCRLLFFHFQSLKILSEKKANIAVYNELGRMDDKLINVLYKEYVEELVSIRREIEERFNFRIPVQENRAGETKCQLRGLRDWVVYIWQSVIITFRGHKNIVEIGK